MILRIFCLILAMVFNVNNAHSLLTTEKVTIKVMDEEHQLMEGISVGVGFSYNTGEGTNAKGNRGLTDAEGKFTATGSGNGYITYGAENEGYYHSSYSYEFKKLGTFGWEPRNPELIVVLRKIGDQIPMYARDTKKSMIDIPMTNKDVGFDLTKFDWVAPYGSGSHSDFIFHLKRRYTSWNDQDCVVTVTFPNQHDGIQIVEEDLDDGSNFKLPRVAPESGYQNKFELFIKAEKGGFKTNFKRNDNYIFRIRSEEDDGKVTKAMYGKILGPFKISTPDSKTAKIIMKYYLNPAGTRNLEYDPKRNLFGKLPIRERVGIK